MAATSNSGSTLKKGSDGAEVRTLQSQLNQLGYGLDVDGDFGPATDRAVRHLQKAFGYTIDGIVGPGTRSLMAQQISLNWRSPGTAEQLEAWSEVLRRGANGAAVRNLQQRLVALGYALNVDGDFNATTEDAIKHLQKAFGYTIDGVVGEATHFLIHQQTGLGWRSDRQSK
jgi:peptidoglycan hydrolase-like protein with peptidoglycan-binding domain